jgi:hypothetical protein
LKKLDIPVVADVPGVGEQYQDHHLLLYPYKTSLDENETIDGILSGRKDFVKALGEKDPILGWNAIGKSPPVSLDISDNEHTNSSQTSAASSAPQKLNSPP